jgi:hypothetical protein
MFITAVERNRSITRYKARFPGWKAPHFVPRPPKSCDLKGIFPEIIVFMRFFRAAFATLPAMYAAGIPLVLKINACRNA